MYFFDVPTAHKCSGIPPIAPNGHPTSNDTHHNKVSSIRIQDFSPITLAMKKHNGRSFPPCIHEHTHKNTHPFTHKCCICLLKYHSPHSLFPNGKQRWSSLNKSRCVCIVYPLDGTKEEGAAVPHFVSLARQKYFLVGPVLVGDEKKVFQ